MERELDEGVPAGTRLVVVVPGYASIVATGRALMTNPSLAPRLTIVSGVACVNADHSTDRSREDGERTLPNVMEQLSRGWVSLIMLTNCEARGVSQDSSAAVQGRARAVNPDAQILRCQGGFGRPLLLSEDAASLFQGSDFGSAKNVALRALSSPCWDRVALEPLVCAPRVPNLSQCKVAVRGGLDRTQLETVLRSVLGGTVGGRPLSVQGTAALQDQSMLW